MLKMSSRSADTKTIDSLYAALARHLFDDRITTRTAREFNETCTTNEARVLFILELLGNYDLFPQLVNLSKNNVKSKEFREEGNSAFKHKNLDLALECYNKSIAYAEIRNKTECLALGYANRSAVLFELKYYKECQDDIHRALSYDYPTSKKQKLIARESKILDTVKDSKRYQFYNPVYIEPENRNDIIKCATKQVKINYEPHLGRHVVATEDILPGDILAIEKPYVAILLSDYFYKNCNNCLNFVLNPVHCEKCPLAMFCNDKCREIGWGKHHRHECPIMATVLALNLNKMAHLALRVTVTAKDQYPDIIKNHLGGPDPSKLGLVLEEEKYVLDSNYTAIHYLIQNTEHFPINDLFYKTTVSGVLLSLLDQSGFFNSYPLEDNQMTSIVAELLLRHIQTAPSNMHQISSWKQSTVERGVGLKLEIGAGAYPFLSMLNHACSPNITRGSYGADNVMRALRPIKRGEQLFDNYGYHHALSLRSERLQKLKEQYFFDCQCQACLEDWPLFEDMKRKKPGKNDFLEGLIPELQKGNVSEATQHLPELIKQVIDLDDLGPCTELCEVQETLKECYSLQGNVYNIYRRYSCN